MNYKPSLMLTDALHFGVPTLIVGIGAALLLELVVIPGTEAQIMALIMVVYGVFRIVRYYFKRKTFIAREQSDEE